MLVVVPGTGHVVTVGLGDVVLEFDQGGGSPEMDGTARPRGRVASSTWLGLLICVGSC